MANSRDFTGKNRKFTGTKGVTVPKGTTGQRVGSESGELRFNTTTELMEYYDGNQWKPIDAPPTISSISTSDAQGTNNILNADGSTLHTITITGGNFGIGANVKFIGNTGTEYTAGNINRVSGSSITCKTTASMGTSDDPYDIQVINTSGLAALFEDAFSFNAAPVFVNASGQLGTVFNGQTISGTTLNAGATDAEGNTITFSIISGSLPGSGLTLSSSTGAITGTLSGTPSLGNYSFVVQAATTEGNINRQFSIQVVADPNYTIDFLVVAGGAGGGGNGAAAGSAGGGGAGGFRTSTQTTTSIGTVITVTVGDGGAAGPSGNNLGSNGSNSSISGSGFSTITSAGGGGGGGGQGNSGGLSGGSGGGGGYVGSGGSGNTPSTSPSQGNNGGNGGSGPPYGGAGGGGAGADSTNGHGTNGGAGTASSISGSSVTRAGGGAGGNENDAGGTGGSGGGGNGAQNSTGSAGGTNTGGGGGGAGGVAANAGGAGGKGVVILAMPLAKFSGTTTGSPTASDDGTTKRLVFNGSGSYTT